MEEERGDLRWGTIGRLLGDAATRFGDSEALVDPTGDDGAGARFSYLELYERAQAVARALIAAGLEPGDRVAIWAPNIWEWPVVCCGLHLAGGVLVPLNTRYKGIEAAYILNRSRAKFLFTVQGFLGNNYVTMLGDQQLENLERVVVLRGETPDGSESCNDFMALDAGSESPVGRELVERVQNQSPDSLSDIMFTSGTTGAPKGVMCTNGQTVRAFNDWSSIVGLSAQDRYLIINPFFHAFGYKAGLVASLTKGCAMITQAVFDVGAAVESIEREKVSMIPGPPTLYQTILANPDVDFERLSSLRLAVTGAAVVPVELINRMRTDLGFETVITGYGLTEACGVAAMCRHDDSDELISRSSGRAIPGVEIQVVDDSGKELPRGETGELVIRGYNVMLGYFESPEQTADTIDSEGWLHTGDLGTMDSDGYIQITDRKKDMFIVGGFNAYPAEIEALLSAHPDIAQSAVIGVADDRMGEVGYGFVILKPGATCEAAELKAWARENMANYKVPTYFEIISEMPLNASGKVLKTELRQRAQATLGSGTGVTSAGVTSTGTVPGVNKEGQSS